MALAMTRASSRVHPRVVEAFHSCSPHAISKLRRVNCTAEYWVLSRSFAESVRAKAFGSPADRSFAETIRVEAVSARGTS